MVKSPSHGKIVIGVVGNPNCGKSTLFNALTGARQEVGNWPGVTVERKLGRYHEGNDIYEIVDLPGVYSLGTTSHVSEDEQVARDFVLSGESSLIVNIVDASNLERNLYLTTQLLEMRVPLVVALNMVDIARQHGVDIDIKGLSEALGCPVVELVAARGTGIAALKAQIAALVHDPQPPRVEPHYGASIEKGIETLAPKLEAMGFADSRWRALKLIEGDCKMSGETESRLEADVAVIRKEVTDEFEEDPDIVIADARFEFVTGIIKKVVSRPPVAPHTISDEIDKIVLNRFLGIPIFLLMMYTMFVFTIGVGGAFIDFFDQAGKAFFVDGTRTLLTPLGLPDWLLVLLADGVGGGIQTVGTFIPIIAFLYLFLSFLEDSGYMARAAFVMDRAMRFIGLPGKSFVPLLVGFGCNVPAIMATRTLETRHDRILTIMMVPFMSCGARLPVYALFATAFFPRSGQNLVFGLYIIGILVAIGTGLLLKNTVLKGVVSPFIMELPPYHFPTIRTVGLRAWDRLRAFIFRCGRVIVPIVILLTVLNTLGTDGTFGNQNTEKSMLSSIGRTLVPVFEPMGMHQDNWPAAVGVFTGFLAKEAVIGTLNALYGQIAGDAAQKEETSGKTLGGKLTAAVATIPANLKGLGKSLADPFKLRIARDSEAAAAEALEVSTGTFKAMGERFDGQVGAFAYLLMILLYIPCVASVGAIYQEIGWRWTIFAATWTTGLGWVAATLFYQIARFGRAPAMATLWVAVSLALLGSAIAALYIVGRNAAQNRGAPQTPRIGGKTLGEIRP